MGHYASEMGYEPPKRTHQEIAKPPVQIGVKRIGSHSLLLPAYQSEGAAAFDLCASRPARLEPTPILIGCGFAFEIPSGWVGRVVPRSSLNHAGVQCWPGTIDSDYRGEVFVCLSLPFGSGIRVQAGDRIAQMIVHPAPQFELVEVEELSETVRGDGAFGSTGSR